MREVTTASGAVYQFDGDRVRRIASVTNLRRDGEWLRLRSEPTVHVGCSMLLLLEPLAEGYIGTERVTTPVVEVRHA